VVLSVPCSFNDVALQPRQFCSVQILKGVVGVTSGQRMSRVAVGARFTPPPCEVEFAFEFELEFGFEFEFEFAFELEIAFTFEFKFEFELEVASGSAY